jgi:tetratricopeptide (TPR) repeat protein
MVPEEGTRQDLGDDLLEKTRTQFHVRDPLSDPQPAVSSNSISSVSSSKILKNVVRRRADGSSQDGLDVEDLLQSAKILVSEGLLDEAKKILRKVLITDSRCLLARELLGQVHETELQQIFGDTRRRRSFHSPEKEEYSQENIVADDVIRELDHDLRLGISDADTFAAAVSPGEEQFPLYCDPEAIKAYAERLERSLTGSAPRDHLDLGIAFLEMELYELAVGQFKAACTKARLESDRRGVLESTALWADALIRWGRAFDGLLLLQPVVRDIEVEDIDKVEFVYLTGRVYEALRKSELAFKWYEQVRKFDPSYRDVEIRIRGLLKAADKKRE